MSRNSTYLIFAATMLLAAPARAFVPASPQQTGSGSAGATSVRSSCVNCRSRNDDRYREKLLLQIDSLRWQIENRRLTDDERRRAATELNSAIRALQQSLDESARGAAVAASMVEVPVAIARLPMRPRGYLGVTFDGPSAEIQRPGDYSVRFYKYPRIALVESSSPAERAGVLQGDTLMSFNGTDVVENEISLTKLLVPDAKIVVRVRRDGSNKDLKVTIGEPPEYYVRRSAPVAIARAGVSGVVELPAPASGAVRVGGVTPAPAAPGEWTGPVVLWQEVDGVAGARVETISEGLGKAIGVDEGVLVMRVRPGTPAAKAGLRDGDVIVRAAGQRIRTVPELRNLMAASDPEEGVKLLIRREKKERDITIRW